MANVRLLRQQVTDYQRNYALNRRKYETAYGIYETDTNAFNDLITRQYNQSASMNEDTDLDRVGATYYDRETGVNVAAGGTTTPFRAGTYNLPTDGTWGHNTYGAFTPNTTEPIYGYEEDGTLLLDDNGDPKVVGQNVIDWKVMAGDQLIGVTAKPPIGYRADKGLGGYLVSHALGTNVAYRAPANSLGAYWDAYDNVWRNAPSGGAAPTQRQTKAPNLTEKEVGILQGEVSPYSYADMAKQDTSPTSVFADPEDPYNLKDAGVLTRAIAGKI